MGEIKSNAQSADATASVVEGAANAFTAKTISSVDTKSTITANQKSRDTFDKSQATIVSFGDALAVDANNIRSIGLAFSEYDEMVSKITK